MCTFRLAQSGGRLDQRVEYNLEIKGRAADDLEHIGGGGLPLQGLAQLVEQPGVLDSDDGLGREVRDKLDVSIGKWPHLLAEDRHRADHRIFF